MVPSKLSECQHAKVSFRLDERYELWVGLPQWVMYEYWLMSAQYCLLLTNPSSP